MKKLKEKNLIRKLCNQLSIDYFDILGFNPGFKTIAETDNFYINAKKTSDNKSKYSIEFLFSIYYLEDKDALKREELYSDDLTNQELHQIADERRELTSISVDSVIVRPNGQGIGTLLINSFIKRIRNINTIKKIFLYPQNTKAENFWRSVGFKNFENGEFRNNKYPGSSCAKMVYDLENNY